MKRLVSKNLGLAFLEHLETGKKRKNLPGGKELAQANRWEGDGDSGGRLNPKVSPWRAAVAYFVFLAVFVVLLARAFDLQVIQGGIFLEQASGNHLRIQVSHAPRGAIFDRNGVILAQNVPGFRAIFEGASVSTDKREATIKKLASILETSENEIERKIKNTGSQEVTIIADLSPEKAISIEAESEKLAGVVLEVSPIRKYPYGEIASHILGYTREADKEDLSRKIDVPYSLGDKVGKSGVEATFEDTLRGINGYTLTNVTATGEKKGEIYRSDPRRGKDLTLSMDIKLQKFVYETLKKKMANSGAKGASAVVMDATSGEILALVSLPSYDNNIFSKKLDPNTYNNLISNPADPLLDRAIGAAYPPGSTFKLVTATAGLEVGAINRATKIEDPGFIVLGGQVFNNWLWTDHRRTEGAINVVRAIARSTDTFFYRLGQMIGHENIEKYARTFNLGKKTGIELPGETAGLVPNEEWKLQVKGEPWYPGETLNISIGQGDLLVSPLQLSKVTAVFANGGKLISPTILKTNEPKVEKENFLKKETIKTVSEGLYQNTVGDGNVGWLFADFEIKTAGKTGTAESGQEAPHAWYTAYAPYLPSEALAKEGPNPKIVVTVQLEHAGHGSEQSAPVVKEILSWYFARK